MAFLAEFGAYLPERVVPNSEMAALAGCEAEWILSVSGIEERRFAAEGETVAELAVKAAEDCLSRAGVAASELGLVLLASGSAERRFPGPAGEVAARLGLEGVPAIDLPMASAGALFGLHLAARMAAVHGRVLVIGAEKMSGVVLREPREAGIAVLFGDGAGACLVSPDAGRARIVDSLISSDGAFAGDLRLEFGRPLEMNGRVVILQASRKIPRAIGDLLARNSRAASEVGVFLMHQANLNLIVRVAKALEVPPERFYSNIRRYGNTSSASMLIAAAEWSRSEGFRPGIPVVLAAFGAGFHWGAMLVEGSDVRRCQTLRPAMPN
ncbi:MAG: ketoacyl-ACP synthase III [Acidobacteria bacterium]|nr:ketoacyl-ACP synthase III [Acidobacteriota bacterium]